MPMTAKHIAILIDINIHTYGGLSKKTGKTIKQSNEMPKTTTTRTRVLRLTANLKKKAITLAKSRNKMSLIMFLCCQLTDGG
jgi:hypothetical protein